MNTLDQSIISLLLQFRKIILFTPLLNLYSLFLNFIYLLFIMSKNIRSHPINTFNQKPSVQQILSYLVIIAQIIIFYVCIYQNITNSHINIAISILFGLSCILLFISGAITSYIDPSDPVVNIYYQSKSNNKQFKAENYLYCNTCDSFCDQTSKHCKLCKRCVNQFDHHCVWINNCIGKANYKQFIFMIIATFIHLSLFLIGGIILSIENGYQINLGSMVTVWIFMLIVGILDLLDLYLIILHFYLIYKGISTFQLILIRRQEQRKKIKQEQIEAQRKQRKNKENKVHNYSQFQNTQQVNQSLKKIEKIEKKQQKIEKIQQISKFEETELRRKQSKGQMTEGAGSVVQKQLKQQSQEIRQQVNSIGQISQRELDKVIKQSQQEQGGSKNLKISNFFRQNKSLKLIISSNNVETPKKVNKMKNFSFAG